MIVRLAYHDSTARVCRKHYDRPLAGTPPLGGVEDARRSGCEQCDLLRDGWATLSATLQAETTAREPDVRRILRDARMALQASLERSDAERIARNDRAAREHLLAWGLA